MYWTSSLTLTLVRPGKNCSRKSSVPDSQLPASRLSWRVTSTSEYCAATSFNSVVLGLSESATCFVLLIGLLKHTCKRIVRKHVELPNKGRREVIVADLGW